MRKAFVFSLVAAIVCTLIIGCYSCANIIPPSGGPRDSIPPVLIKADPPDSSVNFRARRIVLTFNENLNDLLETQKNLLFTPSFENNPVIEVRGKTITIPFRDSLLPNTTYVLNFGNAIADFNEMNVLRDFSYTFSTGAFLDSLELSGRVVLAETGALDTTMIAMLHTDLSDSAVYKKRPQYIARLNNKGEFRFGNLPADTFASYVLGDAGIARRYQTKTQLFAFRNEPVVAGVTDSILLYAYREAPATTPAGGSVVGRGPGAGATANDRRLRFTPSPSPLDLLGDFTLTFTIPLRNYDSTKIALTTDSTFSPVSFTTSLDTSFKILSVRSPWKEGTAYNLALQQDFASDTAGRQLLKGDTLNFTTKKRSDYGSLVIRIRNVDTTSNPVLQFIQNNVVVYSASIKSGSFRNEMFNPGEYELRLLNDTNGNGKWDPGQFFGTKRQPELARQLPEKLSVKANYDNEKEISL